MSDKRPRASDMTPSTATRLSSKDYEARQRRVHGRPMAEGIRWPGDAAQQHPTPEGVIRPLGSPMTGSARAVELAFLGDPLERLAGALDAILMLVAVGG